MLSEKTKNNTNRENNNRRTRTSTETSRARRITRNNMNKLTGAPTTQETTANEGEHQQRQEEQGE